jgi:hypothetical protein
VTDYGGMTVNERLAAAGLLAEFDAAARRRDRSEMIAILMRVELTGAQAAETADRIIAKPSMYGY